MSNEIFKKRVLFMGIPDMAYVCLDGLNSSGVNIVGVIGPKKTHPTYENFKDFVKDRGLNFIEYDKLKDENLIQKVRELNADIAVVCSYNNKIPKVLLESVKVGFINVHPSLLPKYRGANPYSAVIIDNEKETGVTLHFMDENFDTGDIIAQSIVELSEIETMGTLFNRTNFIAFNMLLSVLKHFENNELPRFKQPEGEFVTCKIVENDLFFIDFNKSAKEIESFVRALNPFLVASTIFRQTLTKVYSAEYKEEEHNAEIGAIVKIEEDKFYIATSNGLICPTAVQFGSFFTGSSKDFIKMLNPQIGEKFYGET